MNTFNNCLKISLPRKTANTHQLLDIPQTNQGICTSSSKIFSSGIKFDTDTVGWMGINWLDKLQLRIAGTEINHKADVNNFNFTDV